MTKFWKSIERGVASTAGEVADERRAVRRREHDVVAADLDRLRRVAGQLRELARRGGAQRLDVAGIEVDGDAVDGGAGILEQLQRLGVVADLDADLGQQPIGLRLDQRQAFLAQQLVRWDLATDERRRVRLGAVAGACGHACRAPTTAAMAGRRLGFGVGHCGDLRLQLDELVGRNVTAHHVAVAGIEHGRLGDIADALDEPVASRMEHTAAGRIGRAGDLAVQGDALAFLAIDARHRRQQRLGVRVMRPVEHVVGLADLHDPPEVHHRDAIGEVTHHTEIVADEQVAGALLGLQLGQQVEDGGLHRHVEGAGRLVADDDARIAGKGAGDGDPLLQPARQLARLHVEVSR